MLFGAEYMLIIVVIWCCCTHLLNAQNKLGDSCQVARTGGSGICQFLEECPVAIKDISEHILFPAKCGYADGKEIICCAISPGQRSTTTTQAPKFPNRISAKKCLEYKNAAYEQVSISVGFNERPIVHKVLRCPISTVPLIVGGELAHSKEFPHMALIGYEMGNDILWGCGGALISEQFILTAAHCIHAPRSGYAKYVRLGDLVLNDDNDDAQPIQLKISEHIRHPDYKPPSKYNDIALLKLERPITFNTYIRPACLPEKFTIPAEKVIATGWGSIDYRQETSKSLQKVILELFTHAECNASYAIDLNRYLKHGIIEETQICAGSQNQRKDTCQGDSGGPIQIYHSVECMYLLAGITSAGKGCAVNNIPGIYTRIFPYLDWIERTVWQNASIP